MRTKVIDNAISLLAEYHVGVKTPRMFGHEVTDPGHGLPTIFVYICIISDRERHRGTALRKHDPPPATYVQEWECVEGSVPNLVHRSGADTGNIVITAEPESLLDSRVKKFEFIPKRPFIDGSHVSIFRRFSAAVTCCRNAGRNQQTDDR